MPHHGSRGDRRRDRRIACPPQNILGLGIATGDNSSQSVEADEWIRILYPNVLRAPGLVSFVQFQPPFFTGTSITRQPRSEVFMAASIFFVPSQIDKNYTLSLQVRLNNEPLLNETKDFIGSSASTILLRDFRIPTELQSAIFEIFVRSSIVGTVKALPWTTTVLRTEDEVRQLAKKPTNAQKKIR